MQFPVREVLFSRLSAAWTAQWGPQGRVYGVQEESILSPHELLSIRGSQQEKTVPGMSFFTRRASRGAK